MGLWGGLRAWSSVAQLAPSPALPSVLSQLFLRLASQYLLVPPWASAPVQLLEAPPGPGAAVHLGTVVSLTEKKSMLMFGELGVGCAQPLSMRNPKQQTLRPKRRTPSWHWLVAVLVE